MGKLEELKTTAAVVKKVLTEYPKTRESDSALYVYVCMKINDVAYLPFYEVMMNRSRYRLPCFETVRRARQKIQREFPHLASSEAVAAVKAENQEAFRAFARGDTA